MTWRRRKAPETPPPTDLFAGLLRGVPGSATAIAAQETFPSVEELASTARFRFDPNATQGKTPIGVIGATMHKSTLPDGREVYAAKGGTPLGCLDDRHRLVLAGSRSGKGRSILLPQLILDLENSFLSIDPKGSHASETVAWRAAHGQECYMVEPMRELGPAFDRYRVSFNPMQHGNWEDPNAIYERASEIAEAMVVPAGHEDNHWDSSASNFLRGLCAHVMTSDRFAGKRNLVEVFHLAMTQASDPNSDLAKEMISSTAVEGAVAATGAAFFGVEDRERSSILSTLRRHLHVLGFPRIQEALQDSDFNPDEFLSKRMTGYVCLPARMMAPCAGLIRLMVSCTISGFERSPNRYGHQHQTGGHVCHVVIDEYPVLGRLSVIESAAGQIAGLGARLTIVCQDVGQLVSIHRDRWETFVANAGLISCFGNTDVATLEWLEKRLGTTQVQALSQRNPSLSAAIKEGELGTSFSIKDHALMSKAEIARTFDRDDPMGRMLVFLPSPAIVQRLLYDQHEMFDPYWAWMRERA